LERRTKLIIAAGLGLLLVSMLLALCLGHFRIDIKMLWQYIISAVRGEIPSDLPPPVMVLWSVRLPRILMAVLVGAALSTAGAVFQGLFRNPLVSPGILGVTSGASFGAALAIITIGDSALAIELFAFSGGLAAVILAYQIGRRGGNSVTSLVLAGVIVSALFMAGVAFLQFKADPYLQLPAIVFWTMGSFNKVIWTDALRGAILICGGLLGIYLVRWWLNPLALGDEEARTLGVDVGKARIIYILLATLIVAAAIASCGNIGWVGLVVPHMARLIVGPDHDVLIPFSAVLGGLFMLYMDTLTRTLPGGEVPVGVLTAFVGAPFFAYLLIKTESGTWQN